MMSVASKSAFPSMLISIKGTGKNQLYPGPESMGDYPVLSNCLWLRNPLYQKSAVVLEHCGEGETNCWFPIFTGVSS